MTHSRPVCFFSILPLGISLLAGCGPSADDPLPPETDLHAYSLAVAEKARLKAPEPEALGIFHVGRVHERFGLGDTALELYRKALRIDPNLGEAYRQVGFILSQRKDSMGEAVDAYQDLLRVQPDAPGIRTRIALIFTHQNRLDEAIQACEDEVRAGKASEDTHYNLGQALFQKGKHAEAALAYREAIRLAPGLQSAHYGLMQSLRAQGKAAEADEAKRAFDALKEKERSRVAAAPPEKDNRDQLRRHASETWMDAAALFAAGVGHRETPEDRRAALRKDFLVAVREAMRLDPENPEPRKVLVEFYRSGNDIPTATRLCEEAFAALPREPTLASLAFDLARRNIQEAGTGTAAGAGGGKANLEAALRLLRLVLDAAPDLPEAHVQVASLILFHMKDRKDLLPSALHHQRRAVDLQPTPANYDLLANAYAKNGRMDLAGQALQEGIKKFPGDPGLNERWRKLLEQ